MDGIYENIEEYNPNKKHKISIVFADVITDMFISKKVNQIVTELFTRGRKLNISLAKNIRLKSMHYFIMKFPNKQELQQIAFNHSSDIDFQDFLNLYKNVLQNYILL